MLHVWLLPEKVLIHYQLNQSEETSVIFESIYIDIHSRNFVLIGSVVACHLLGAKPLSEPILLYCQLHHGNETLVKFKSKHDYFHWRKYIWKWRPQYYGQFHRASAFRHYGDIWRQWNCHFAPLIIMTCIVAKHTTWHLWKRCDAWFVSAYWRKCSSGISLLYGLPTVARHRYTTPFSFSATTVFLFENIVWEQNDGGHAEYNGVVYRYPVTVCLPHKLCTWLCIIVTS